MRWFFVLMMTALGGCSASTGASVALADHDGGACAPAASSSVVEARIAEALDTHPTITHAVLRLERADGRVFVHTKSRAADWRYISSSTAKPVMVAAMLHQVDLERVDMDSRTIDVVPTFAATGAQVRTQLRHLIAFSSPFYSGPLCWQEPTGAAYDACVDAVPTGISTTWEPGSATNYNTLHLDVDGRMVTAASPHTNWQGVFDEWRTATGLFGGATWNTSYRIAASREFNITAEEYAAFLRAVQDCTMLTPEMCRLMTSDAAAWDTRPSPAFGWHGEDWRWCHGFWRESRTRVSTIGLAGQYAYFDEETGHRFVLSATWAGFTTGFEFSQSIDHLVDEWARL